MQAMVISEFKTFGHIKVFSNGDFYSTITNKILKSVGNHGYKVLDFRSVDGKSYLQHIIVATLFIPNPLNLPCVNHKDGNKLNCNVDNLEWSTYSHNNKHAYDTGLKRRLKVCKEAELNSIKSRQPIFINMQNGVFIEGLVEAEFYTGFKRRYIHEMTSGSRRNKTGLVKI